MVLKKCCTYFLFELVPNSILQRLCICALQHIPFSILDEELEVNEMAAETLKARKSAKAAMRTNPAGNATQHQQPVAVQSDDDDF